MKRALSLVFVLAGIVLAGCAHFRSLTVNTEPKHFAFEREWVRHTPLKDHVGYFISHIMAPVIDGNVVIAGNEFDSIRAYNKNSGQNLWKRFIAGGVTSNAHVYHGTVYFGAGDGHYYALDSKTGRTIWAFKVTSEGIGTPLVTAKVVYFVTGTNSVYAVDRKTGEQIWLFTREDNSEITVRGASEPTLVGDRLYVGLSDGYLIALDKTSGKLLWQKQLNSSLRFRDVDAKPVLDDGRLYVSSYDGKLYCLDANTGQTIWIDRQGGFNAVTIIADRVYYSTSTHLLQALDKNSGQVLWEHSFDNTVGTQPVYDKGLILVGEWDGPILALNARTGKKVASFFTGMGVTARPTIDPTTSMVYLNTRDANLFALKLKLRSKMDRWPWIKQ